MGWRFRRSLRILPGVRLNVSKRGLSSVSVGRRGLTLNVGRKGTKETIGLSGSGLSYTTPIRHEAPAGRTIGWVAMVIGAAIVVVAALGLLVAMSVR